ncbi:MAG: nucleoside kinase [Candidatus Marinimicrobia bacterium]|nr:nucleoside kinase [Candidatus Neomarinimicrobiota bacterium]
MISAAPQLQARENPSALHASLGFLLAAAAERVFPDREFFIEHSFLSGYYCHFGVDAPLSGDDVALLAETLGSFMDGKAQLELLDLPRGELQAIFEHKRRTDKLEILRRLGLDPIPAARFETYCDYRFEPMVTDMQRLANFKLTPYDHGFVLRFPSLLPPFEVPPFRDSPKLYQSIRQRHDWGRSLRITNLRQMNKVLEGENFREMVLVAEGLHEKTVAEIADAISAHPQSRAIFVSGPSSSGKTTFAKRLAIQLKVNGLETVSLSMDDYFFDQADMAPEPDGSLNFEGLDVLDVERLIATVKSLLAGEESPVRRYSFKKGKGAQTDQTISLPAGAYLIVEGIHGLNPVFSTQLGDDQLQRVYVSAITQLSIDNEHRISSSDNRLLRRMVRDQQFRGYDAEDTLLRWPSVRLGEEQHVFRYQEAADFMFNSALIYELAALRPMAEIVLRGVPEESPAYPEASRLATLLSFTQPMDLDPVPRNSILREFLGGSAFRY